MKKHVIMTLAALLAVSVASVFVSCKRQSSSADEKPDGMVVYIGTYGENLYRYIFDPVDATFTPLGKSGLVNPSYLALGEENQRDGLYDLYAVSENGAASSVASFADDIKLSMTGQNDQIGNDPCFLLFDRTGNRLFTADYSGGSISVFYVNEDGSVGDRLQTLQFEGSGPVEGRQESSHIHQIKPLFSTDSVGGVKYFIATDLGADRIRLLSLEDGNMVCHPESDVLCGAGSGPRHIEIDTLRHRIYCLTELSGELLVLDYVSGADGVPEITLSSRQVADEAGSAASADIHLHPSGKFLYTSHRDKNDGIAVFTVSDDGTLSKTGYCKTGKHPRNFAVTPDGAYVLVACRNDKSVEVYSVDQLSGKLSATGTRLRFDEDMPSCVVIAR